MSSQLSTWAQGWVPIVIVIFFLVCPLVDRSSTSVAFPCCAHPPGWSNNRVQFRRTVPRLSFSLPLIINECGGRAALCSCQIQSWFSGHLNRVHAGQSTGSITTARHSGPTPKTFAARWEWFLWFVLVVLCVARGPCLCPYSTDFTSLSTFAAYRPACLCTAFSEVWNCGYCAQYVSLRHRTVYNIVLTVFMH